MPKFQARYFDAQDEEIPVRVEPVEAPDHATALELARAGLKAQERVEVADIDDEFRRGTPHGEGESIHGLGAPATPLLEEALGILQDSCGKALETATAAGEEVVRFTKARPYAALGIAAFVGALIGLHLGAGDRRVIYLRDER